MTCARLGTVRSSVMAALAALALAGPPAAAADTGWTRVEVPAGVRPLAELTAVSAGSAPARALIAASRSPACAWRRSAPWRRAWWASR